MRIMEHLSSILAFSATTPITRSLRVESSVFQGPHVNFLVRGMFRVSKGLQVSQKRTDPLPRRRRAAVVVKYIYDHTRTTFWPIIAKCLMIMQK